MESNLIQPGKREFNVRTKFLCYDFAQSGGDCEKVPHESRIRFPALSFRPCFLMNVEQLKPKPPNLGSVQGT